MVARICWGLVTLNLLAASGASGLCGNLVRVPLDISFADARYNTEVILRSLEPQVEIGLRRLRPKQTVIENGRLLADFCVAQVVIDNASEIVARIGSEEHALAIRPIQDRQMTTIKWVHPRAPTWTIVQSASWSRLADGRPVLDLQLFNYGSAEEQAAVQFQLLLLGNEIPPEGNCFTPAAIPIEVGFAGGEIQVFSAGATYPEPIKRSVQFWPASCEAPHRLAIELGPTRPIAAGEASELRFIFSRSDLPVPGLGLDALALPERRLIFGDDSGIYPRHVPILSQ